MTEAAYTILEQAQQMEEQSQQLSRTLFGRDGRLEEPISLTMTHDMFEHCLADDLAQFQREHPDMALNLIVSPGLRNLNSREADLAIRLDAPGSKRAYTQTPNPQAVCLAVNAQHPAMASKLPPPILNLFCARGDNRNCRALAANTA